MPTFRCCVFQDYHLLTSFVARVYSSHQAHVLGICPSPSCTNAFRPSLGSPYTNWKVKKPVERIGDRPLKFYQTLVWRATGYWLHQSFSMRFHQDQAQNEASLVQYKYSQQILCTGGIHIRKDKTIQRMERRRIRHGWFIAGACEGLPPGPFAGGTLDPPGMAPPASPGPGAAAGGYETWFAAVGSAVRGGNWCGPALMIETVET